MSIIFFITIGIIPCHFFQEVVCSSSKWYACGLTQIMVVHYCFSFFFVSLFIISVIQFWHRKG